MFTKESYTGSRVQQYETVIKQLDALLTGESNVVANLSNASALLNQFLDRVNWVGFYVTEGNQLVLGPFQGMPACVRIPFDEAFAALQLKRNNAACSRRSPIPRTYRLRQCFKLRNRRTDY